MFCVWIEFGLGKKPVWQGKPEQFLTATFPLWFLRTWHWLWLVGDWHVWITDLTCRVHVLAWAACHQKAPLTPDACADRFRIWLNERNCKNSQPSFRLVHWATFWYRLSNPDSGLPTCLVRMSSGFCVVLVVLGCLGVLDELTKPQGVCRHDVLVCVTMTPALLCQSYTCNFLIMEMTHFLSHFLVKYK